MIVYVIIFLLKKSGYSEGYCCPLKKRAAMQEI